MYLLTHITVYRYPAYRVGGSVLAGLFCTTVPEEVPTRPQNHLEIDIPRLLLR